MVIIACTIKILPYGYGLMEKQDLDMDTDTDICACTMVGLDYWTYPYYLF